MKSLCRFRHRRRACSLVVRASRYASILVLVAGPAVQRPFFQASAQQQPSLPDKTKRAEPEVRPLTSGQPIERELAAGQTHAYLIGLSAGQFIRIVVEQKGANV